MKPEAREEKPVILVVDDEPMAREGLFLALSSAGYEVEEAGSAREALDRLGSRRVDLVLTDLKMPGMSGLEFLDEVRVNFPYLDVVVITGYATIDSAVTAVKKGAADYLTKPYNLDHVRETIKRILSQHRTFECQADTFDVGGDRAIVGRTPKMRAVFGLVEQVAPSSASVLITGESGTGKELIARALYRQSGRADKPFLTLNCASLSSSLLENELFGHEKGAFTDARDLKRGLFEAAHGGTIFLDEIGDIGPEVEVRLLRVLQEREVVRVGGTQPVKVDFRLISATSKNLKMAVDDQRFRRDLYYRLNVISIHLPPLKERSEDLPDLVDHFLQKFNRKESRSINAVSAEAMAALVGYSWPGNVRELENVMERAVILARSGEITMAELPPEIAGDRSVPEDLHTIHEHEREYILHVLEKVDNNTTRAAKILGIDRSTLWRKLKTYGIKGE